MNIENYIALWTECVRRVIRALHIVEWGYSRGGDHYADLTLGTNPRPKSLVSHLMIPPKRFMWIEVEPNLKNETHLEKQRRYPWYLVFLRAWNDIERLLTYHSNRVTLKPVSNEVMRRLAAIYRSATYQHRYINDHGSRKISYSLHMQHNPQWRIPSRILTPKAKNREG